MKKIFFLLSFMHVGGVEKSFLGLLSIIPPNKYEIHLGLLSMQGELLNHIPPHVHVHHINCYDKYKWIINRPPLEVIKEFCKQKQFFSAFIRLLLHIFYKLTSNSYYLYKWLLKDELTFPEKFDIAISYAGPSQSLDYYVCKKIKATEKYGWIHFDISQFGIDKGMTKKLYKAYKKIYIVSESAKKKFDEIFPEFKTKTEVFYNIISIEEIQKQAISGPTFTDDFQGIRILTVGRLSYEKGQDIAISTLKHLIENANSTNKYNIRWYFIGDGKDRLEFEQLAKNLNISENVSFLGIQSNPYKFMKDCDIYVQPSRHEGYCITLAEAKCFDNPIIATNFTGAKEQLKSYSNSFICLGTPDSMADSIQNAISNLNHKK